ncbi:plasmid pRiA4b ORF-3 family protein [Acidithiobacillus ferrooxidans]|uniref:plasmid pRiA4b ORF-3 family protein n=1 Tax=Acidithiobacillus ferrooxidans TaxID=920 RepID=UPI00214BC2E4|nr:plasmid pRiA4b ORF-3 family protein [Acidithiobacillus ferrooxidans]MCR2831767.1 plasmid pRiA4b ORF-3 family protein [Acidithiobacillus ferrooxidans]
MKIENPASVWRLKVELLGVAPTVWRRFDTYADVNLSQLHYFTQGAKGWELAHMLDAFKQTTEKFHRIFWKALSGMRLDQFSISQI